MSHTPGPWTVIEADWNEAGDARYVLEGIKDVNAADARLIASAPDLLEAGKATVAALQGMLEELASAKLQFGSTAEQREERERIILGYARQYSAQLEEAAEMLSAAIAKAEGREP